MFNEPFMQIHLGRGPKGFEEVSTVQALGNFYLWESEVMKAQLMRLCPPRLWPHASYNNSCPRPILVNLRHEVMLRELNTALTLSLTDIVDRWWSDKAAKFPQRMPLEPIEEGLLKVSKRYALMAFFLLSFFLLLAANKVNAVRGTSISYWGPAALLRTQRIVETRLLG
jgi:hypothetical protein